MLARLLFALLAMTMLAALLYFQEPDTAATTAATADTAAGEPGFVALGAQLIQTGDDGQPLYRLDASRIEQPTPSGTIFLTEPRLNYRPPDGSPWTLTALRGELPQDAHAADLHGRVHAEGRPTDAKQILQLDTDNLHVDMTQQIATTPDEVRVVWGAYRLRSRGARANLMNGNLLLQGSFSGVLAR